MRIILVASVGTVKRLRVSLGTLVAIEATDSIGAATEAAIERAFEAIERVNRLMHPTAQGSDLARINHAPLNVPTRVHVSIGRLLNLSRRINTITDGVFDPCTPAQSGRLRDIEVSVDETQVICHAPVALDFGGFAKGYAVDCAVEALIAERCTAGLVNAGGDLRVFGRRSEPVFVRGTGGELIKIDLTDAALAVSDATAQQRPPEHQGYYVRNRDDVSRMGRHGRASQGAVSPALASIETMPSTEYTTTYAAVIATTAAVADALAKCVLLCPPPVASRALEAFGATNAL
jgi:thiamine biosynthesis lipoprotein